jgi:hypothetical protein
MVEVKIRPVEKVVIHEVHESDSSEELVANVMGPGGAAPLAWASGVLFTIFPLNNDEADKEYINGTFHINLVEWCKMPKYSKVLDFEDEIDKGVRLRVRNMEGMEPYESIAAYLKRLGA